MAGLHDATATAADAPAAGSAGDKKIELTGAAEAIERLQKAAEKVAADAAALKAAPAKAAAPTSPRSNQIWKARLRGDLGSR